MQSEDFNCDVIDKMNSSSFSSSIANDFPKNLMIISRIISKLVTPHIYSYYEEHAIVFVSTPLLNVITKIKLFFESSTQDIIESINTSAICNEV